MSLDQDKNRHYSLRKLSVGLTSVLIGISFVNAKGQVVKADNVKDNAKSAINEQSIKPEKQDMQSAILKGTSEPTKQNAKNVDMVSKSVNSPSVQTSVNEENRSENSNLSLNSNDVSSLNKNMQSAQNDVPRENRAEVTSGQTTQTAITQPQKKQQTSSTQNAAGKLQKNLMDDLNKQKISAQAGDQVEDNVQTQLQNSQKLDLTKNRQLAKKVLATNLIETNSLAMTNGGFDSSWGTLDVNNWQGSVQGDYYQLTNYTGDPSHIIVPNEADFEKAGKSTNGLQVGINRDTVRSLLLGNHQGLTIAFSKTKGEKVKAIGTDWSYAFSGNSTLSKFDGSNLDVSSVTNMSFMLESILISDLTSLVHWDTSKVTNMSYMFNYNSISDLTPLSHWNTNSVTNMSHMFDHNSISDLTSLAKWDTSNVTNMGSMFDHNSISDLTGLAKWDTSKVTDMNAMFSNNSISDLTGLAKWDTSKVTDMSLMFDNNSISNLTGLAKWDTSKVTDMGWMFYGNSISDLTGLDNWNTSKVIDMKSMFYNNSISNLTPLSHWDVSNVTNMRAMFENNSISNLTSLANWNTSKVTYMASMFADNPDIIDLKPIANWNISNVAFDDEDGNGLSGLFDDNTKLNLTNINNTSLMQGFLKEPDALIGTTFITNNADLIKATTGKDLPTLTNTAKRIIIFNLPHAEPKTITQTIYYKNTVPAVQIDWFDSEDPEIGKPYSLQDSDWQLDASNSNVTVNGQPSTEYKAYTLDPNGKDIDFAAIPLPKIPGYKAQISRIPSGNSAQPAMLLISFAALPSVNPSTQNMPDDTKQDQDAITDTKHLNTSNMQIVSNQPALVENADNSLQMLNADTNTSIWQIENNVAEELIAPYVVFNSNYKLHLPRFNNYNLQIIKHTSNKDNLSFVYLDQNKAFKYVFNIKIEDGKYLLSISEIENKRLIPVQEISFNDYHQLIKLIVKLINK